MPLNRHDVHHLSLDIHAMPCSNRCKHCWVPGAPGKKLVPFEQVSFVIEKLAEVRQYGLEPGAVFFYDEPTLHPQFLEILEEMSRHNLTREDSFIATNGVVLARSGDDYWRRCKAAGMTDLQLTFYGLEATHDDFAQRRGTFRDLVTTAKRALEHGVRLTTGVIFHSGNARELAQALDLVRGLDPSGKAVSGWLVFSWQGRGRSGHRLRAADYALLPESMRRASLVEERQGVERILGDDALAAIPAGRQFCDSFTFQVERDLQVYAGGACDTSGAINAAPEVRQEFALGKLGPEGFGPLLEQLRQTPSRGLRWLDDVTWGDLATRYGDRANDEIYWLNDLPNSKWAAAYLLERARG